MHHGGMKMMNKEKERSPCLSEVSQLGETQFRTVVQSKTSIDLQFESSRVTLMLVTSVQHLSLTHLNSK